MLHDPIGLMVFWQTLGRVPIRMSRKIRDAAIQVFDSMQTCAKTWFDRLHVDWEATLIPDALPNDKPEVLGSR